MKKILIVENDDRFREYLLETVRNMKYVFEIDTADCEERAKGMLSEKCYDVIITDNRMESEDSGLKVLEFAKNVGLKNGHNPKVIVVTSYGNHEYNALAMEKGAYAYVERSRRPRILEKGYLREIESYLNEFIHDEN